ncbi:MAG: DEAD/DEAH box helicase family protein, partial [Planctomycetota bacterium]
MADTFPEIGFRGELRPSQRDVVAIARKKLGRRRRRLHIVAPPGSGKTVLGLYLWAEVVRRPALVLSPNSAIQAQWAAKTSMFDLGDAADAASTDPRQPALLTSLTYQSVTLPRRGGDDIDAQAVELWQDTLIEKGQATDPDEAAAWIGDLQRHNPDYHAERLAVYRRLIRDDMASNGQALQTLHASALANLRRLKEGGIGLIIFDECHHLLGHWGRVLAEAHELLEEPVVVGLTATPPDAQGRAPADVERYEAFFGPVDYEVPVPSVVKDGFLAPYQDLAYFVRPAASELVFVARADQEFDALVEELCSPPRDSEAGEPSVEPLPAWLTRILATLQLPTARMRSWTSFEHRDPDFALAARLFLIERGIALPEGVPPPELEGSIEDVPQMAILGPVLDRYIRHRLRQSEAAADRALADRAIARLRMLGVQITETGSQPCASPVGRVMAYSRSKMAALVPILRAERETLGEGIRAVVVTDYEKTSVVASEVGNPLEEEAGGAVAAFRALLAHEETDELDPVLVTGSTVLVDDDLAESFEAEAAAWLAARGLDVELVFGGEEGFHLLRGRGADWCPRVYVALITDLFQRGVTRCLVGTRGLLGEGWDAERVNVLVDLTTVTTSTSVRQLRGRSIRLDPQDGAKLASNWDVVCIAPEFSKGFDDYLRFIAKHRSVFGLTDDGAIEKGVGHVHAAFTELKPEGIEGSMGVLNAEMLERTGRREQFRQLWR